jgi:hypothetical protein
MATRDPLEASIAKLRSLFTTAERKLLDSSTMKKLTAASEREVKDLLRQCRTLRDKWRDLVGAQARTVKRTNKRLTATRVTAATPTNERSRQKHGLFRDAVANIEAHLASIAGITPAKASPAKKKPTAKRAVAKTAAAARTTAKKTSSAKTPKAGATATRAVSRKARQAGAIKALESSTASGLHTSKSGQRKATAALKAERLKLKGVTTRRAGHTKVQGARAQARRDGRNAKR